MNRVQIGKLRAIQSPERLRGIIVVLADALAASDLYLNSYDTSAPSRIKAETRLMIQAPYFPKADLENSPDVNRRTYLALAVLAAGLDLNRLMFARFTLAQRKAEEWKS